MDYTTGTPKEELRALRSLRSWPVIINMKASTANHPGDKNSKAALKTTQDSARFVTAALDLGSWDEEIDTIRETINYKEVVATIEKLTEDRCWRKRNPDEELKKLLRHEETGTSLYKQVKLSLAQSGAAVQPMLNTYNIAPNVKPRILQNDLKKYCSGVELGEPTWAEGNIHTTYGVHEDNPPQSEHSSDAALRSQSCYG